jgi:hypothetical protein
MFALLIADKTDIEGTTVVGMEKIRRLTGLLLIKEGDWTPLIITDIHRKP